MDWHDKVVVITGSSIGIGFQLAREAGRRGASVVINARNAARLEKSAQILKEEGIENLVVTGDISKPEDCLELVAKTIARFGKIDTLVHNAGVATHGTLEQTDHSVLESILAINFTGPLYLTKLALPSLKTNQGNLLFVSSIAGLHGLGGYSAYCTSKMALTALAESLDAELSPFGVYTGIAYVGFTENEPGKTMLDPQGGVIPQPARVQRQEKREVVAARLLDMIEKRKFRSVFSTLGRFTWLMNRLSPSLVQFVIRRAFRNEFSSRTHS